MKKELRVFWCDEKAGPGHKCQKQAYVIQLHVETEGGEGLENYGDVAESVSVNYGDNCENEEHGLMQLSLQTLQGSSNL